MKSSASTATFTFDQPSSVGSGTSVRRPRKSNKALRTALLAVALVVAAGLYWMQLQRLTHVHKSAKTAAAAHAAPVVTQTATPAAKPVADSPSIKKTISDDATAVWTYLLSAGKAAPAPAAKPQITTISSEPATTKPVAVSPSGINTQKQVTSPAPQTLSAQDKLLLAAQTAFATVMDAANKYPDSYGFKPEDVLLDARLGTAMPVYMLTDKDCAEYQAGQPVKPLLKPADRWVFPVMMGDRVCCMVQVSFNGHNYIPGGGNKTLAIAWNKIVQTWPASQGFHPQIVVNPNIPGYYFTVPELPKQNVTDISNLLDNGTDLSPAAVILASWR